MRKVRVRGQGLKRRRVRQRRRVYPGGDQTSRRLQDAFSLWEAWSDRVSEHPVEVLTAQGCLSGFCCRGILPDSCDGKVFCAPKDRGACVDRPVPICSAGTAAATAAAAEDVEEPVAADADAEATTNAEATWHKKRHTSKDCALPRRRGAGRGDAAGRDAAIPRSRRHPLYRYVGAVAQGGAEPALQYQGRRRHDRRRVVPGHALLDAAPAPPSPLTPLPFPSAVVDVCAKLAPARRCGISSSTACGRQARLPL